jgi:hypothetical protein
MRWRKLGLVYRPDGTLPWAVSHAMIPTPMLMEGDIIRVYATFCDADFVGRAGYVDLEARDPTRVRRVSTSPVLDVGIRGAFDENGVAPLSVVRVDERTLYLYFVGFELGTKIRYRLLTGLAVSEDGGASFRRVRRTPVLERSDAELYFRCGPCVRLEQGRYRMWYIAGSEWTEVAGKEMPVYSVKYAESADGIHWPDAGTPCLAPATEDEHGFGRPYVVRDVAGYRMYLSVRRRSVAAYRLGYAVSADGINWTRRDRELGLDVSPVGWDSQAIMYSAVIEAGGRTYAFYNGNDFGRDGFGVAVLERD